MQATLDTSPLEGGSALCRVKQDLLSAPAREVMAQAARTWLDRRKLTAFELTHHAAHSRALADDGTHYANMVQRVAVVQVRGTQRGVGERVKELYDLVDQAQALLLEIERALPAELAKPNPAALALHWQCGRQTLAATALAGWLAPLPDWMAKASLCLELLSGDGSPAEALLDAVLAEILQADAALPALFGAVPNMAARLEQILALLAGTELPIFTMPEGDGLVVPAAGLEQRLAGLLHRRDMPRFRAGLADRFTQLLAANGDLATGEASAELAAVRGLRKAMAPLPNLTQEEGVRAALMRRYARLSTPEVIIELFEPAPGWGLRVAEAFRLYEELEEGASRQNAMKYIAYAFDHRDFLRDFAPAGADRAKLATALRVMVNKSSVAPHRKEVFNRTLAGLGASADAAAEAERRRMARSLGGLEDRVVFMGRPYPLRNWSPVGLVFGPVPHPPRPEQPCPLQVRVRNPVLTLNFDADAHVVRVDEGIIAVRYRCKEKSNERKIREYFGL